MSALAKREQAEHEDSGPTSILAVIDRASRDSTVDVDKLERLLGMYERVTASQAKQAYIAALAEAQDKLPKIQERGEIKIGTGPGQKYALWEDINEAIKPILKEHGFALSFRTGLTDGKIIVTGVLAHRDGHSEETTIYLPSDTSGSKNAVQAVGSSTSYGKRYTAIALLNITSGGEDDDGRAGGAGATISQDQADEIITRLNLCNADIWAFCNYMKVDSVNEILARDLDRALKAVAKKEQQSAGGKK